MTNEQSSPRKIGIGMLLIAWAMIFGLLGLFFKEVLDQQQNPNSNPLSRSNQQFSEVVLYPNRQHHYVTTGEINHQPVVFLLDTGATEVVIPAAVAVRLGLKRGRPHYASTANGTVQVYNTQVDDLTIGDIELTQLQASINPAMEGELVLLGMSALSRIDFSQSSNNLILRQQR